MTTRATDQTAGQAHQLDERQARAGLQLLDVSGLTCERMGGIACMVADYAEHEDPDSAARRKLDTIADMIFRYVADLEEARAAFKAARG